MKKLSILPFLLVLSWTLAAQNQFAKKPMVSISGFSENFGLAAVKSGSPIHLGGTVAITFIKKQNTTYRATNSLEVGYFRHAPILQAAYLAWKPSYGWQFDNGLQVHGLWGVGYLHALPTQQTYTAENGIYKATTNLGKAGGMASIGVGVGYQFAQQSSRPISVFARQELMVSVPFNLYKDLPAGFHSMLSIGIQFSPFNG